MMNRFLLLAMSAISFTACTKTSAEADTFSEAVYKVTYTGKWRQPAFVVPANVHFTPIVGLVHNKDAYLFKLNQLASLGVENVAEAGNSIALSVEMDSLIAAHKAIHANFIYPFNYDGSMSANLYVNSNYSYYSFLSMIAPSPDWFVGLSQFNLLQNNKWIADTTINIPVYDAGTEDGDVFGYDSPPTMPQQTVQILQAQKATVLANGNSTLAPMVSVRFVKQ
jgi:Spondin_N